jgi:prepilin-type N-terminal cleavage/methylation domain-containing protein
MNCGEFMKTSGFTLIELLITMALTVIVMSMLYMALGFQLYEQAGSI